MTMFSCYNYIVDMSNWLCFHGNPDRLSDTDVNGNKVSVTHKLPLETKSVANGNNVVLTCEPCQQTSIAPYSTANNKQLSKA